MWNRQHFAVMATAAVASFGLTLATFYPRLANAVDQAPAPTVEVKVPTLNLGTVAVTAAMDPTDNHTMILTLRNTGDADASAHFLAQASVTPESDGGSRRMPSPERVWNEEYSLNVQGGATKTVSVKLPDNAFVAAAPQPADSQGARKVNRRAGGRSYVMLTAKDLPKPKSIVALTLPNTVRTEQAKSPVALSSVAATPANPDSAAKPM
jgi:hypothetical protein